MSPSITVNHIKSLESLVYDLNTLHIKLGTPLKPKFHFLTHYPTILRLFGLVVHFWTMRYESKLKDIKASAVSTRSQLNLLKTISLKQVLQFCHVINELKVNINCTLHDEFKVGSFVILSLHDSEAKFGKIINVKNHENDTYLDCEGFEELYFDFHYHAYYLERNTDLDTTVNIKNLSSFVPFIFNIM